MGERFNCLEKELVEKQARSIVERFNCLEKELVASVGKHARLLQEHSELHGKQAQDLEERKYQDTKVGSATMQVRFADLADEGTALEKELGVSVEKQARSIEEERFNCNCLEKELASVGKHARLLQEHSEPHGKQAQDLDEWEYQDTKVGSATMQERFADLTQSEKRRRMQERFARTG